MQLLLCSYRTFNKRNNEAVFVEDIRVILSVDISWKVFRLLELQESTLQGEKNRACNSRDSGKYVTLKQRREKTVRRRGLRIGLSPDV